MYDLFTRLESKKKRVIAQRQIEILKLLLRENSVELKALEQKTFRFYRSLNNPVRALLRDLRQPAGWNPLILSANYWEDVEGTKDDEAVFRVSLAQTCLQADGVLHHDSERVSTPPAGSR